MKYAFVVTCKDKDGYDIPVAVCNTKVLATEFAIRFAEKEKANSYYDVEFMDIREVPSHGDII